MEITMSKKNAFIGLIAWFIFMALGSTTLACLDEGNCGAFDFLGFGLMSLGLGAPAYGLAFVLNELDKGS